MNVNNLGRIFENFIVTKEACTFYWLNNIDLKPYIIVIHGKYF